MNLQKWFNKQNPEAVQDRKDGKDYWKTDNLYTEADLFEYMEALLLLWNSSSQLPTMEERDLEIKIYHNREYKMNKIIFTNIMVNNLNESISENGKVDLEYFIDLTNKTYEAINFTDSSSQLPCKWKVRSELAENLVNTMNQFAVDQSQIDRAEAKLEDFIKKHDW